MTQLSRTRGVGSQLSKYHCFIFEKFADSVHNKEIVPQSEIFPELMKTVGNIQFQGGPRIVSAQQICGTIELRAGEPATIMAPILCPGHGARSVHHSIMTRQYLSSLERDTGNKTRPPPGLSPGLACPGPRQTLGRSEKPKQ